MADIETAKLFEVDGDQVVVFPEQIEFQTMQVRLSRHGKCVLVEPFDVPPGTASAEESTDA